MYVCRARAKPRLDFLRMSLITAAPLSRSQLSPFHSSLPAESNQQVPGSPLSPFFGRLARLTSHLSSPSSGSPLAQVPESGSPLLRQVLISECLKHRIYCLLAQAIHILTFLLQTESDRETTLLLPRRPPSEPETLRESQTLSLL